MGKGFYFIQKWFLLCVFLCFIYSRNLWAQALDINTCPTIEKRSNGNGQASSAAGDFSPYAVQNNPVAPNVTGTKYQKVPYLPASKTGNVNFKWTSATSINNLPVITRVWLTASGSNSGVLSPIKFGPPPPATASGQAYYASYSFYNMNMPPAGKITMEFTNPQTSKPVFYCTFDLASNTSTTPPIIDCKPSILAQPTNSIFCDTGNVTFALSTSGVDSYQWQYLAPTGGAVWTNLSQSGAFTKVTSDTLTVANRLSYTGYKFRVLLTNDCGTTTSSEALLTVNSKPTATFASSQLCGLNVTRSMGIVLTGTAPFSISYTTTPVSGSPTTTNINSITSSPYYISVAPTVATTYSIIYVGDAKCDNSSPTGNVSSTVNATPTIAPSNVTVCAGQSSFSLAYTAAASPNRYSITTGTRSLPGFVAINNATITTSPLSINIPTAGVTAGTYDFNIIVSNSTTGCTSSSMPFTLTVNAQPIVSASASASNICAASNVTLTAAPGNLSSYAWSANPVASVASTYSPTVAPAANTTYTVTGTDANGCSATASSFVSIIAGPTLSLSPSSPSICNGNSTMLTASGGNTYSWSPATGLSSTSGNTVIASPSTTTIYTVTSQNSSGCASVGNVTVTVTIPNISVTPSSTSICSGSSVALVASGASTYNWYPSATLSAATGASVNATPTTTTTYYVQGTTASGCIGTASANVAITPAPINAATSTPANLVFCTQGVSSFPLVVYRNGAISSMSWAYATTAGGAYTTFSSGTVVTGATLTPTVTADSAKVVVSAYGSSGYAGPRYFRLTIVGPTCTFYYYILISDTKKLSTGLMPAPTSSRATICSGDNVALTIGTLAPGSTAQWQDSSSAHTWANITSATLNSYTSPALTTTTAYRVVYNGGTGNCGSTSASALVNVVSAMSANTISPATTCSNGTSSIALTGSAITGATYQWQSSTTSSSTGFNDVFGATGQNYTLSTTLVANTVWYTRTATAGNCASNTSTAVAVYAPITNNQIANSTTAYCSSASPTLLSATVPVGGSGSYTYQWQSSTNGTTFTDIGGAVSQNYTTSTQVQSYWYRRIVTSGGCSSTSEAFVVTVNTLPTVTVNAGTTTLCSGLSTTLTANGALRYSWSPNTAISSVTGTVVTIAPLSNQVYTVMGTDANGCSATANASIVVTTSPMAPTLSTASKTICSTAGSINLNSLITSGTATYEWYIAPIAAASYYLSTPTSVSQSGNYYVFTKNGACYSSSYASVAFSVNDVSAPLVTSTNFNACAPATANLIAFQPLATQGTVLEWHTGNTSGSPIVVSPSAAAPGTYYLFAYSTAGACYGPASSVVNVVINALPTLSLSSNTVQTCSPNTIDLSALINSPNSGYTYQWYSADSIVLDPVSLITQANSIGTAGGYYGYAINNITGCASASAVAVNITINQEPVVNIIAPNVQCINTAVSIPTVLQNASPAPSYQWKLYDASTGNWNNLSNTSTYSGDDNDTLYITSNTGLDGTAYKCLVSSSNGCSAESPVAVVGVDSVATPTVNESQPTCIVATGQINITTFTELGYSYSIDGNDYSNTDGIFTTVPSNTYAVTAKNMNGCISTEAAHVVINTQPPTPAAPVSQLTQPTCNILTGSINVVSPVGMGISYSLNSSAYDSSGLFSNVPIGTYSLKAKNAYGCISAETIESISDPRPTAPTIEINQPQDTATKGSILITSPTNDLTFSIDSVFTLATEFRNLEPATYTVLAKNNAGCISEPTTQALIMHFSALPIKLVSFKADRSGEDVVAEWTTCLEINNAYFTLEKSFDAKKFNEVGIVDGAGNSTINLNYKFTDTNPGHTVVYYRLKQTDYDGASSYSSIVSVGSENTNNIVSIYPNPTHGMLNIRTSEIHPAFEITLADINGAVKYNNRFVEAASLHEVTVDLSSFVPGVYILTTAYGSESTTNKVIVTR